MKLIQYLPERLAVMRFTPRTIEALYDEVYDVVETYDIVEEYVIPSGEAGGDEVYTTTITVPAVALQRKPP